MRSHSSLRQRVSSLEVGSIALAVAGGWILLVAGTRLHEMLVGVVVVAASTAFLIALCKRSGKPLRFEMRDLVQCWRLPWDVVSRIAEITAVLFKDLFSSPRAGSYYRVSGFKTSKRDGRLQSRTVLATVYTTVAPNFIVIGVDADRSRMLFHQIERTSVPKMTRSLGAQS